MEQLVVLKNDHMLVESLGIKILKQEGLKICFFNMNMEGISGHRIKEVHSFGLKHLHTMWE